MAYPSIQAFVKMIDNNLIMNCPVIRRDIMMTQGIFGPSRAILCTSNWGTYAKM